jgi:Radical SAM superfamily
VPSLGRRRATVRLLLSCNNQCAFCAQDGLTSSDHVNVEADLAAAREHHDEVTFTGGEPTLDEQLAERIAAARALGFRRIGVQTNGSRLANATYAGSLASAGLTDVHLSLHGADARVHDYHTGRAGSFADILGAIHAARTRELAVVVTTVLTRSNFRVLAAIPPLLAARAVAGWFVTVPVFAGRAAALRDRVAPRLGLAIPFALHALAAARALKVPSWIVGAPLCLLGPFASHALGDEPRAYAPACDACAARPACSGVDPEYLARFGGDELGARDAPPDPLDRPDITAMFVGTGERARPDQPSALATARPRTSLPLLGKVKPAIAEAAAGTERRSGDALKEIFPTLFEGDAKR